MPDTDTQGVALEQQSAPNHPLSYHLDRLNAWLADLWAANSLTLHMSDGTVRTGQFGVLRDIRDDAMVLRRAYLSAAQEGREAVALIPRAENCGRYLAEVNDGRLLYLNHANTWQECPNFIIHPAPAQPAAQVVDAHKLLLWAADSFDAHAKTSDGHPEEIHAYEQSAKMYRECADRLIASPTDADAAVGWRSMDSAPKDGTRFLAFEAKRESQRYECWWQDDFTNWEGWQDDWDSEPDPTHWMPLPAAPLTAAKAGEDGR